MADRFDAAADEFAAEQRYIKNKTTVVAAVGFVAVLSIPPVVAVVWTAAIRYIFGL